jgi:hypothetical protein
MPLTIESRVSRSSDLLSTELDGESIVMNIQTGQYFGLDDIGTEVWRRLALPTTISSLCRDLEREFDEELSVIEADVIGLMADLLEKRLIEIVS